MTSLPGRFFSTSGIENLTQALIRAYQEVPERETIHLLFSRQPDIHLTYRDLLHRSARFAAGLQKAGLKPDEVVVLVLQHGSDLVAAFFGAVLQGAIPAIMPFLTEKLHPEQYRQSLAALLEITRPAAIITYAQFEAEARSAAAGTSVRTILIAEGLPVEAVSNHPPDFQRLAGSASPTSSTVLLQHSSGTTGLQKGVALSHQAVFNQLESYTEALRLTGDDVVVSWLPLYHDMGLIAGFILPVLLRLPLVLMSPFDWVRAPYRLLQAVHHYRGTLCWLPNFAYNFCAQKIRDRDLDGIDLSSLRAVINCSEPMHWKSHAVFLERFQPFGLQPGALATCYAMAENVFAVTQGGIQESVRVDEIDRQEFLTNQAAMPLVGLRTKAPVEPERGLRMLSAGQPIPGTQIRVVDERGQALPERRIGEITIRSDCMLTGYYHRPDLTRKAFRDGWYLTGDLGYLAGGELFVTGRKKDLIIVGGKNIYPQDLENLAGEVEGVHPGRVVAFGLYNDDTGTEDVVVIAEVDRQDWDPSAPQGADRRSELDRIGREIQQKVARGSDVAVRHVHLVERNWLIKTSSGKVARSANKEKYSQEVLLSG